MLFSIEGNIGSGKSTLVRLLKKQFVEISDIPIHFVDEPVSQWEMIQNEEGKNMIQLFYSDPQKYSFAFQMMAYISRLSLLREAILKYPKDIIITERCLLTDYHVFAKMLYENKSMLKEEYDIYQKWFYYFQQEINLSGIIYVKTDPEVAFQRCEKRARPGETITLEYLTKCHENHEEWISQELYDTYVLNNNEADPEDVVWMIHDYIADHIWEMTDHYNEPEMDCNSFLITFAMLLGGYIVVGLNIYYTSQKV